MAQLAASRKGLRTLLANARTEAEKTLGSAQEDPEGAAQGLSSSTPSCTATH